jgi:LysM repeat protein
MTGSKYQRSDSLIGSFFTLAALCMSLGLSAQGIQSVEDKKYNIHEYIDRFKDIAIREMERSGIPASITLAQGIQESGIGNSLLAREANNHFGIKCHKGWQGKSYYQWDDDPTESCFRVYSTADSSYIDHTEFLKGRKHYAFLFDYESTDYVSWAHGLKKANYATDPTYPQKLIGTIERYKLQAYDLSISPMLMAKTDSTQATPILATEVFVIPEHMQRKLRRKTTGILFKEYKKGLFRQNGSTYATARPNETALEFATRFDIPYRKFLLFNDLVDGDRLVENQFCFIQPKKSKYKGEEMYHQVKADETMYEIAQYYGIKLSDLLERNLLLEGQEPKNGEMILLNEKAFKVPALRTAQVQDDFSVIKTPVADEPTVKVERPEVVVPEPISSNLVLNSPTYPENVYDSDNKLNTAANLNDEHVNLEFPITDKKSESFSIEPEKKLEIFKPESSNANKVEPKLEPETVKTETPKVKKENFLIYTVQAKDTLFSLGKKYGLNWEKIKEYNNLASNDLREKQVIRIPR